MAATKNCAACNNLQEQSADFVQNGVTTNVCTSLKNDTGFSASNGNNDCTDLDYANDCLIGNMEDEVDAYEVCDWKEYAKKYIHNHWTLGKAMICAMCGIWTNIHNLWTKVNKHDCEIELLFDGFSFDIGEEESDGSYVVAGKGVSFLERSSGDLHTTDIRINYIGGALGRVAGGLSFHTGSFDEPDQTKCWNYDLGEVDPRYSYNRRGNELWNSNTHAGDTAGGNELIYEIRVKKSQYPQIKQIIGMFGQESNIGGFHFTVSVYNEGAWASGQHGSPDENGNPRDLGGGDMSSPGHKVPSDWIYVQLRMSYIWDLVHGDNASRNPTPLGFVGIRFNRDNIPC